MERFSNTNRRRAREIVGIAFVALAASALSPSIARAEWLVNGNRVSDAPNPKYNPAITASGADGAIVAWADDRTYNAVTDIYATRILLTGERDPRWPATGLPVCTAPGSQFAPRVVSDGLGGAIIAWMDDRDEVLGIFAQRLSISGSIAPGWTGDGVRLCSGVGGVAEAVSDNLSGVIAAWRDVQSGASDVRAQRVSASGSVADGWPQDGLILVAGTSRPNLLIDVIGDGEGGAIVTWYTTIDSIDVYAQRVTASGAVALGWPATGVLVCNAPNGQFNPRATTDGNRGAFIAWSDLRTGNEDIYAGHLLATGSLDPNWPENGVPVCQAQNVQQNPRIVQDLDGGFVAVWMDFRSGTSYDIYAQRITGTASVAVGWPHDGERLCAAPGHQFDLAALSDGAGGLIAAWEDERIDVGDVYAQRITATGSIAQGWITDGVLISNPPNVQGAVALATDSRQGTMICWADRRFDQDDVYVQRVSASGAVGPDIPSEPVTESLQLLKPRPHPVHDMASLTVRLPVSATLTLAVMDVRGRHVALLQDRSMLPPGDHIFTWNARDDGGNPISPGVYFVRATTERDSASHKLVKI